MLIVHLNGSWFENQLIFRGDSWILIKLWYSRFQSPRSSRSGGDHSNQHSGKESDQLQSIQEQNTDDAVGVIVVNRVSNSSEERINFRLPFKPLIPIGHETLSSSYIQLQPQPIIDLGLAFEHYLRFQAESVVRSQNRIVELIREADTESSILANHIIAEKEKRIRKVVASLEKLGEIEKLFDRYEASLESCLSKIDLLNKSLPQHLKLETFTKVSKNPWKTWRRKSHPYLIVSEKISIWTKCYLLLAAQSIWYSIWSAMSPQELILVVGSSKLLVS